MEKEKQCWDGAMVERGQVVSVDSGKYTVRSYGRDGLVTPGIPAITGGPYTVNQKVYFFMFQDGHGAVIGAFE